VVVTVRASKVRLTGIAVIPSSSAVFPEDRVQLAAWGVYSDGTSEDISDEVSWDARDPAVADVDQNGLVTAHAPGRAWIGATRRSQHGHVVLEVGHRSATLTAITVEPAAPGLSVGESVQLQATGSYDDNVARELTEVEWSSDADDVATVDDTGLLTGLAAGSATITATVGDVQQPVEVSVLAAHLLVAIKVTPSAPDLCPPAKAVALQVEATYEDGSTKDVTKQVSWTSRDEKVVTVDATGQATRTGPGSTSITATLAGKADTVKVASCPTTNPSPSTTTPTPPTGTAPGPGFRG
jgi:uncharacterized protein YjdB